MTLKRLIFLFPVFLMSFLCTQALATDADMDSPDSPDLTATDYMEAAMPDGKEEYTEQELQEISDRYAPAFEELETWLETAPPPGQKQKEREEILKVIDEAMYFKEASKLPCVAKYYNARLQAFIEEFRKMDPNGDTIIWKLYNHTEIIQTDDIVIAIDLYYGFDGVRLDESIMNELIDNIDVFLLTHKHGDHYDRKSFTQFVKSGRPVIAPESPWSDFELKDQLIIARDDRLNFPGARIRVFPSMQKTTLDNVYLILTDNGHSIMHLGDNNNFFEVGHEWFRKFKKPLEIDVLIPNIWTPDMASLINYVKPKVIISSHEHELGHKPSGRRSYDYVYKVLHTVGLPYLVPAWGEYVRLPAKK